MALKSELFIKTALRGNITYLKEAFFKQPFKLADIRENKQDSLLQLMLMSSSPGILDGDQYEIQIDLAENSALQLHTQSYQRIFTMSGEASQQLNVRMLSGSFFYYLPHPTVPHEGSSFKSVNKIYLSTGCELIFGEILTCGRKLNGEVFGLRKYHNLTEIYLNEKLIIKENLLIQPELFDSLKLGLLEGYTHQASLIYLKEDLNVRLLQDEVVALIQDTPDVEYGTSELPCSGMILRVLGNKAEQLHNLLKLVADLIRKNKLVYGS